MLKNSTMTIKQTAKDVASLLIKIGAVSFRFDPPYTFTSGLKSPVYLDNRLVMSFTDVRKKIIKHYLKLIEDEIKTPIDWISATATAAIPQGAWIADRLDLPMVFVRPATKSYGKGVKVEGFIKKGVHAVIIEDHISTAESAVGNAETLRSMGVNVQYCVATTTYETRKSVEVLKEHDLTLLALTTGKIMVETAFENGKLSVEEKEKVDLWFTDPPGWAKKMGLEG